MTEKQSMETRRCGVCREVKGVDEFNWRRKDKGQRETDVLVLEFDHQGDKLFDISRGMQDHSLEALLAEMAKCEVVCANCHRRRTAIRGGFLRAAVAQR